MINKYRIKCETDDKHEYVLGTALPTVCPTNAGHTVSTGSGTTVQMDVKCNDGSATNLTLANYKALRYCEIDLKTTELIGAGFTYDSKTFSLSDHAQSNCNRLLDQEARYTFPVDVTTNDNDTYSLAEANNVAFWTAMRDQLKTHLDSGRALKKSVFDAADEAAVDAVVDSR